MAAQRKIFVSFLCPSGPIVNICLSCVLFVFFITLQSLLVTGAKERYWGPLRTAGFSTSLNEDKHVPGQIMPQRIIVSFLCLSGPTWMRTSPLCPFCVLYRPAKLVGYRGKGEIPRTARDSRTSAQQIRTRLGMTQGKQSHSGFLCPFCVLEGQLWIYVSSLCPFCVLYHPAKVVDYRDQGEILGQLGTAGHQHNKFKRG